jgi:phospholipid/cholesterol/gamma-HCH transport system permease protein
MNLFRDGFAWIGAAALFGLRGLKELFRPPYEFKETSRQLFSLGLQSVPLIALSGLAVGVVMSMHTTAPRT